MPADTRHDLSVVLPAYAEAENLREFVPALTDVLSTMALDFEILVIDTQKPKDDTAEVCRLTGTHRVPRRGGDEYGNAIRTGIEESTGSRILIMDVDGSHHPEFVRELWVQRNQADIIIASRYTKGGSTDNPFLLVLLSQLLNTVFALILRMPVRDISNSFRLYHGDQLRRLELTSMHFDIQEEILARLLWTPGVAASVLEVPFHFRQRSHGSSKRNMAVFTVAFIMAMGRLWMLKRNLMRTRS
ncbi:MAG: glycosyltransferase [Coriobacteriia bacterium]|nr:glycosyltransferase [Coriobacteriia bacterium]